MKTRRGDPRRVRSAGARIPGWGAAVASGLFLAACGESSPSAPPPDVAGVWHGVSATQLAGAPGLWYREDLVLQANGAAVTTEYEGRGASDTGTWALSGDSVFLDFANFCDRRGTVNGKHMRLACVRERSWDLTFVKE